MAPPCQSTEGHNSSLKSCMWRTRPSSGLSNEPGLPEDLLGSTLGNLLPHGGIHSLFLALGIPPWLPGGSMCGKNISELCIVTTMPSSQGPILEMLGAFLRPLFPLRSHTKASWTLAKILRGSQVLWGQWAGLVSERALRNLAALKVLSLSRPRSVSICICFCSAVVAVSRAAPGRKGNYWDHSCSPQRLKSRKVFVTRAGGERWPLWLCAALQGFSAVYHFLRPQGTLS